MVNGARRLWLIDASYLFNAQRSVAADYQFNYLPLRAKLEEDGPLWRAYYLNSIPDPPTDAQNKFHIFLRSAPPRGPKIITRLYGLKPLRADHAYCNECQTKVTLFCPNGGGAHQLSNQQQKGVDVGIATLALIHRDKFDTLILSSGDGDLLDAVEFLSEQGKSIELAVFNTGVSADLQARADKVYWINDFAAEVRRPDQDAA